MPAKFQLNTALTRTQRDMLDEIEAGGRGPDDQVVIKMLLAALEDYWTRFKMLPSPMRVITDASSGSLLAAAEDRSQYEATVTAAAARTPAAGAPVDAGKAAALAAKLAPSAEQKAAYAKSQKRK